jgi:hypothetical protein
MLSPTLGTVESHPRYQRLRNLSSRELPQLRLRHISPRSRIHLGLTGRLLHFVRAYKEMLAIGVDEAENPEAMRLMPRGQRFRQCSRQDRTPLVSFPSRLTIA